MNGSADVTVEQPIGEWVIIPQSNLRLIATASHPSGVISKVEFLVMTNHSARRVSNAKATMNITGRTFIEARIWWWLSSQTVQALSPKSDAVRITVDNPPIVKLVDLPTEKPFRVTHASQGKRYSVHH